MHMAKKTVAQKRIESFISGQKKLLDTLKLGIMFVVEFPGTRNGKVPALSRFALRIIQRQGGRISVRYTDLSKK